MTKLVIYYICNLKKIYVVSETERKVLNTYDYDLKLVGTFDSEKELIGYNKCFISVELLMRL